MIANVSTIIPCYRCADTIGRAVDSVAKQTLLPTEVILVDDGSGDNTPEILLQLQQDYDKDWIKVILLEDNQGPGFARNTAWNLASHDYLAFLDADEAWHPEKIDIQYSWMIRHPEISLSAHNSVQVKLHNHVINAPLSRATKVDLVSRRKILLSNVFSTSCVMLKRSLKPRFSTALRYAEDYLLWLKIILGGDRAALINFSGAYYFKSLFGESGLTANLLTGKESELEIYRRLWQSKYINVLEWRFLSLWSSFKHYRRVGICSLRQVNKNLSHLDSDAVSS